LDARKPSVFVSQKSIKSKSTTTAVKGKSILAIPDYLLIKKTTMRRGSKSTPDSPRSITRKTLARKSSAGKVSNRASKISEAEYYRSVGDQVEEHQDAKVEFNISIDE